MSFDVGIMISNEKKRKRGNLVEVNLSSGWHKTIGHYKTTEKALKALEKKIEELNAEGVNYEAVFVKGFSTKRKRNR